MDTFVNPGHGRRHRRQYSQEFKRDAVAACLASGVSMASVALANGMNANVLCRWVNEHETSKSIALATPLATSFAAKPSGGKSAQPTPSPASVPLPACWRRRQIDPGGRESLTHPHVQKTQVQRGLWLGSHGSVEIGPWIKTALAPTRSLSIRCL